MGQRIPKRRSAAAAALRHFQPKVVAATRGKGTYRRKPRTERPFRREQEGPFSVPAA